MGTDTTQLTCKICKSTKDRTKRPNQPDLA